MSSSFASVHFVNVSDFEKKYIDPIKPYAQRPIVLDFLDLPDPEILAVCSNNVLSLFCEEFGMESIDEIVCKSYKDTSFFIVTVGILDGDILSLSIIQSGQVISNITVRDVNLHKSIYPEFKEKWLNIERFEELFGVSEFVLKVNIDCDLQDTLSNWAKLLKLPIDCDFEYADEVFEKPQKHLIEVKLDKKNAKIIKMDEVIRIFEDNLKF